MGLCSALLRVSSVENKFVLPLNMWMIKAQGDPHQAYDKEKQGFREHSRGLQGAGTGQHSKVQTQTTNS